MDDEAVNRLRRIAGRLSRQLNASSTAEGLTPTQASILSMIDFHGPVSLSRLCEMEGLNPTMLSRIITRLVTDDLICRTPFSTDMRAASVEITEAGRALNDRIKQTRTKIVAECSERLTSRHAQMLTRALPALEALAEELKRYNLS